MAVEFYLLSFRNLYQQYFPLFRSLFDFKLQWLEVIPLALALIKEKKIIRKADCPFQFLINLQTNLFSANYLHFATDFSQMLFQGFHKNDLDIKITIIGLFPIYYN